MINVISDKEKITIEVKCENTAQYLAESAAVIGGLVDKLAEDLQVPHTFVGGMLGRLLPEVIVSLNEHEQKKGEE